MKGRLDLIADAIKTVGETKKAEGTVDVNGRRHKVVVWLVYNDKDGRWEMHVYVGWKFKRVYNIGHTYEEAYEIFREHVNKYGLKEENAHDTQAYGYPL